ncbi:unnamed protein product [Lactuca saligna]|uniref:Small ribosomal subunit protein uS7 domain-containing protein n=1 Tax=Lactuca saligna TaxID=75948 RepID=A0AA35ZF27_LACSI|nr:unnamed protein product [Lactuca saligna]
MSRRGTAEEKTAKSNPIYRNRLVNMLVNRILKHGKKSLAYQIIYRAVKKDSTKDRNKSTICFTSSNTWSNFGYSSKSKTCRWIDSARFEPTTSQLTADRSTTELLRNNGLKEADSRSLDQPMTEQKGVRHPHIHREKGYDSKPPPRPESLHDKEAVINHPLSRFVWINRSSRPASSLSRLTLPRGNKG